MADDVTSQKAWWTYSITEPSLRKREETRSPTHPTESSGIPLSGAALQSLLRVSHFQENVEAFPEEMARDRNTISRVS